MAILKKAKREKKKKRIEIIWKQPFKANTTTTKLLTLGQY